MNHRKQLANVIEDIIVSEHLDIEDINADTIQEYKSLNEKCDQVISKIKKRKSKSQPPT